MSRQARVEPLPHRASGTAAADAVRRDAGRAARQRRVARFLRTAGDIRSQHYAFLLGEAGFDRVLARIRERGLPHWADPAKRQPDDIYRHNGGRGVYFDDPDGHFLEVMTQPYALNGQLG
ncbi:glyoxalase-like domain protein [Burkholderia cepacia]|nr:glyoxalase-like domain protein [Burkholderia cepacia]